VGAIALTIATAVGFVLPASAASADAAVADVTAAGSCGHAVVRAN
jgi:hypothetical protein